MDDLWTRWQALKTSEEFTDEMATISGYRNEERRAELPVPFCCAKIAGFRLVQAVPHERRWSGSYRELRETPQKVVDATNCPFCGTKLPGFRLKASPPPHLGVDEDSGYCALCKERCISCMCSHPESAWEVDNAPEVKAVAAVIQGKWSGRDPTFLSVSRKNDPTDKGFPGGSIEPGETPEQALVREVLEETGLVVKRFHLILDVMDSSNHRCQFFRVTEYEGKPSSTEKGLIEWLEPEAFVLHSSFGSSNLALMHSVL